MQEIYQIDRAEGQTSIMRTIVILYDQRHTNTIFGTTKIELLKCTIF